MLRLNLKHACAAYEASKSRKNQDGVILMIIPIVVIIVGVFLGYMSRSVQLPDFYKEQETQIRMERVLDSLSLYVQRFHRIPCPANPDGLIEPFGFEDGSGGNGNNLPLGNCGINEGLIPWNTLGLSQEDAIDEWGEYMTYAISPAFAVNPVVARYNATVVIPVVTDQLPRSSNAANMTVHAACRTTNPSENWINPVKLNYIGKDNIVYTINGGPVPAANNPWKARFCCAGGITIATIDETTDLRIDDNGPLTAIRSGTVADYARGEISVGAAALPIGGNIEVPVVALVSHGINQAGAYLVNGTNNRSAIPAASFGANEIENTDGDRLFIKRPKAVGDNPANYYDDIVMYRTQNTLYSQTGSQDCTAPF